MNATPSGENKSTFARLFGADASTDDGLQRVQALIGCLTRNALLMLLAVGAVVWVARGTTVEQWAVRIGIALACGGGVAVYKLSRRS